MFLIIFRLSEDQYGAGISRGSHRHERGTRLQVVVCGLDPRERGAAFVQNTDLARIRRKPVGCRNPHAKREIDQRFITLVVHGNRHGRTARPGQRHGDVPDGRPRLAELVHRAEPDRIARPPAPHRTRTSRPRPPPRPPPRFAPLSAYSFPPLPFQKTP